MHKYCFLKCDSPLHKSDKWSASTGSSYFMDSTSGVGGQYSNKTHEFGGSKRGVLYKECKQVCWCHIKPDPVCKVCSTVAKNYDCISDRMDAQTAPFSRDKTHTSDIRKVVKPTVSSNTTRLLTNLNELALSSRFEVLATNSDVELDIGASLAVLNDSVHSQDLQRSACSADRSFIIKKSNNDTTLAVDRIFNEKKSVNANTAIQIHKNLTSDNEMVAADAVNSLGNLDTMDPVAQATQMDTVDFIPVWLKPVADQIFGVEESQFKIV